MERLYPGEERTLKAISNDIHKYLDTLKGNIDALEKLHIAMDVTHECGSTAWTSCDDSLLESSDHLWGFFYEANKILIEDNLKIHEKVDHLLNEISKL